MSESTPRKIFSFDVFDTCITRRYLAPTDLFRTLASQALSEAGIRETPELIESFHNSRIAAEAHARKIRVGQQDITLDQIYQELKSLIDIGLDWSRVQQQEIELELSSCVAIASTLAMVRQRREEGVIVYLSDMYLPRDCIQRMLRKTGFWQNSDRLYVSNDVGKSKHHVDLYRHVLQSEEVPARAVFHLGDNARDDVRMARKARIRAVQFVESQLNTYEQAAKDSCSSPAARDFVGLNRALRLSSVEGGETLTEPPAQLVAGVIAPFLTTFVAWVLKQAKLAGKERLYFVSRDAQIFFKIAQILNKDTDIECRYLYGSRKAWFAPSLMDCSVSEIRWAYDASMTRTPQAILKRLDLNPSDWAPLLSDAGFGNFHASLDENRTNKFIQLITQTEIREAVLTEAHANREKAAGYFQQEGLFDNVNWSLVDIGWVLNCQASLNRILQSIDPAIQTHGFYLGVGRKHIRSDQAGSFTAYFAQPGGEFSGEHSSPWIFNLSSVLLLEHLFTPATHGTVTGYDYEQRWLPRTQQVNENADYFPWVQKLHQAIEDHARAAGDSQNLDRHLDEIMAAANSSLEIFLSNPEPEDVRRVAWITTNVEQAHGREHDRRLASSLSALDIVRMLAFELSPFSTRYVNPHHAWLNGSAAISAPWLRQLFLWLQTVNRKRTH